MTDHRASKSDLASEYPLDKGYRTIDHRALKLAEMQSAELEV